MATASPPTASSDNSGTTAGRASIGAPTQGCRGSTMLQLAVQEGKEAKFLLPALSRFVHPVTQFPPGKAPQLRDPHEKPRGKF